MLFYRKYFGPQQKYCVQVSDVPGVVRLLDYVETRDSYYIVMETQTRTIDLFDFISAAGTLPEDVAREIFGQVSCDWRRPGHVTTVLTSDWSRWWRLCCGVATFTSSTATSRTRTS